MFVYVIVNNESLKIYIGQHKGDDLGKYLSKKFYDSRRRSGARSHLYAAFKKYPRDCWSIWPLVSGCGTQFELDELERHYIRVLKAQHPDIGYNICDGGRGVDSPDKRSKLSAAGLKLWSDIEYRERQRQARAARYASPEFHALMVSAGAKGRKSQEGSGYKKRTEAIRHKYATLEMRQKMSEISTTASSNPELKAKRVKAIKQAWTLEKRAAMSETMKRVYSVNPEARERLKLAADKGRKSRWG